MWPNPGIFSPGIPAIYNSAYRYFQWHVYCLICSGLSKSKVRHFFSMNINVNKNSIKMSLFFGTKFWRKMWTVSISFICFNRRFIVLFLTRNSCIKTYIEKRGVNLHHIKIFIIFKSSSFLNLHHLIQNSTPIVFRLNSKKMNEWRIKKIPIASGKATQVDYTIPPPPTRRKPLQINYNPPPPPQPTNLSRLTWRSLHQQDQ